jgi:urease accessory protein
MAEDSDASSDASVTETVTLPFDSRQRSRLRVELPGGRAVLVQRPRGSGTRHGDVVTALDGTRIRVLAAWERVSVVRHADALLLTRVAYHLGNRHVPLMIEPGCLRYLHDHVLDSMLNDLGLLVTVEDARFEPEPGPYQKPGRSPAAVGARHDHGHDHAHGHDHPHPDHGHSHPQRVHWGAHE